MNTYRVKFYVASCVAVIVKAFHEQDAADIARQQGHRGKIPTITEKDISIEADDIPLENEDYGITVEKI